MSIEISPKSFFEQPSVADMRLISCPGAEELTGLIDKHLVRWAKAAGIDKETFIIPCDCPRFQSGDAKGLVKESVRGDDIFIVVDPGNYSVTYKLFNYENHMSPYRLGIMTDTRCALPATAWIRRLRLAKWSSGERWFS